MEALLGAHGKGEIVARRRRRAPVCAAAARRCCLGVDPLRG